MQLMLDFGDFDTYKGQALRTEARPPALFTGDTVSLAAILRIAIAAGDLVDFAKKTFIYGKEMDYPLMSAHVDNVLKEAEEAYDLAAHYETRSGMPPDRVIVTDFRLLHAVLGLVGESGELAATVLHNLNGEELDLKNLEEEDGDVAWYTALLDDAIVESGGVRRPLRLAMNIAKLQARFPEKFSLDASKDRCVNYEAAVMEAARGVC
jgi:NTP pyrophosphatase (non-canonical NTP hydrolase)